MIQHDSHIQNPENIKILALQDIYITL